MPAAYTLAVVGNPNCGKTTVFNGLTGTRQRVGNWPGVTVERKTGDYRHDDLDFKVVDLPGTYSLDVTDQATSPDEMIARDFVHDGGADLVVNIVDASNIERNLYLTAQLIEMRRPMLVVLNMTDVAESAGIAVDADDLATRLGCPVLPYVAIDPAGVAMLKARIAELVRRPAVPAIAVGYSPRVEDVIGRLAARLENVATSGNDDPRWLAARLLEGDDLARRLAARSQVTDHEIAELRAGLGEDIDLLLADGRYGFAHTVARAVSHQRMKVSRGISDRIDTIVLNRLLGIPIFLAAMYLMFMFTINIGGAFIDFFDIFAGAFVVEGFGRVLDALGSPPWLTVLLADGIGGGIQVVATFIPIIAFLYLFLSALEDSGYMARAAFVMDRLMQAVGLPGKSFIPLIVGFGCNVPAIMATRTLEYHRDRVLTIVMAPFMSCGARLPVYALFAAAFFPTGGQNVVFGLYLIGIAAAVLTGLVMRRTLLPGPATPSIMEMPPYHVPTAKGVLLRTWDRTRSFVVQAGQVIVPMVLVLNVLNSVGTDGTFGNEDQEDSVLSEVGRVVAPAFSPMGLDEENWPAAVGILTGILAKEAVVGTLDALYTTLGDDGPADGGEPPGLADRMAEAAATVPANLRDAFGTWRDPLGIELEEVDAAKAGTYGAMAARFDGTAGAFAYLLFILLYFPCTAALAAVFRETNLRWTAFVAAWTTGIAYVAATVFYQAATFSRAPAEATSWIVAMLALLAAALAGMRWWGRRQSRTAEVPA